MTIINTYSRRQVNIENPDPETINIRDIAHALSFLCRGGGHSRFFFPVARHCVYCAMEARARGLAEEVVLACLLHDGSEAYMVDLPKPIKDGLFPQYRIYENNLLECIYRKFIGRSLTPEEKAHVEEIDQALLMYDLKYLLDMDVELPEIHIELKYEYEPFEASEEAYLRLFRETAGPFYNIPEEARFVLEALNKAGFEAYIVGGCVRDMLMGRTPVDFDVTTSALPEQVKETFESRMITSENGSCCRIKVIETGIKHGTVTVLAGNMPVEVTTFRTEGGYSDGRHPDFVEFTGKLEEDLARRDFTMNALAWNEEKGLIDYFGGKQDIEAGCIRAVGDAGSRFKEDALRILRAVRFTSALGFETEPETEIAMMDSRNLLGKISAERIREELTGLLIGKDAGRTIMKYADIIGTVIPEILKMKGFLQKNPHHIYDVLEHSAVCVDKIKAEPCLRWAALLHDVGKPETFSLDEKGTGHFYGHTARSGELAEEILRRLRFDNDTISKVTCLVRHHDLKPELTEKAVRRALSKLGEENLRDLILLQRADNLAQSPEFADRQQYYDSLEEILEQIIINNQCFSLRDLAIDGNDLINAGITEGKTIGMVLKATLDEVIDGKIINEKEPLLNRAVEIAKGEKG